MLTYDPIVHRKLSGVKGGGGCKSRCGDLLASNTGDPTLQESRIDRKSAADIHLCEPFIMSHRGYDEKCKGLSRAIGRGGGPF